MHCIIFRNSQKLTKNLAKFQLKSSMKRGEKYESRETHREHEGLTVSPFLKYCVMSIFKPQKGISTPVYNYKKINC